MVHFKILPPLIPPPVLDFFNHNLVGGLGMPLEGARGVSISATAITTWIGSLMDGAQSAHYSKHVSAVTC